MRNDTTNTAKWLADLKQVAASFSAGESQTHDQFSKVTAVVSAETWGDFVTWSDALDGDWGFRGQDSEWLLDSSLDRAVKLSLEYESANFFQHLDRRGTEEKLLFKFKQQAHRYVQHLPREDDLVSWLALMQHHGTPTRLLDWTKSPYVAAYFAFESEPREPKCENKAAIWAVNLDWLRQRGNQLLQADRRKPIPYASAERASYLNDLLSEPEDQAPPPHKCIVVEVEPARTDAWMTSQLGFFLSKVYLKDSFSGLLMRMMLQPPLIDKPKVLKLELSKERRFEFLGKLRLMNIHRGSLFPDLDGFARSLHIDWQVERETIRRGFENALDAPTDDSENVG